MREFAIRPNETSRLTLDECEPKMQGRAGHIGKVYHAWLAGYLQ